MIESIKPKNETPRQFVTLASAAATCAVIVIVAASLLPRPLNLVRLHQNYSDAGVASLYVWANSLNKEQTDALRDPGDEGRGFALGPAFTGYSFQCLGLLQTARWVEIAVGRKVAAGCDSR